MPKISVGQIKGLSDLVRDTIEASANASEAAHLAVARRPFEILEQVDVIAEPVKAIEHVQVAVTRCVYHTIRTGNQTAAALATCVLDRFEERIDSRES